jgi:hypothetical protein
MARYAYRNGAVVQISTLSPEQEFAAMLRQSPAFFARPEVGAFASNTIVEDATKSVLCKSAYFLDHKSARLQLLPDKLPYFPQRL